MFKMTLIAGLFIAKAAIATPSQPKPKISKKRFQVLLQDMSERLQTLPEGSRVPIHLVPDWESEERDAQITRNERLEPVITVHGGLARHALMTEDALKLFVCHELGHYFGGAPKLLRGQSGRKSWSSVEGQSDYYATAKCLPRLLEEEEGKDLAEPLVSPEPLIGDIDCLDQLCLRLKEASLAASMIISDLVQEPWDPEIDLRDPTVVSETLRHHPSAQCRLDTFVAGIACRHLAESSFDDENPELGACQEQFSARPKCWFAVSSFLAD